MNERLRICFAALIVIVFTLQTTAFSNVTGIDILSQEYHVWGYAGDEYELSPGGTKVSYDRVSSSPVEETVTGTYIDPDYEPFAVDSSSSAGWFAVEAHGVYWYSDAFAGSTYTFRPSSGVRGLIFQLQATGYNTTMCQWEESNVTFAFDDLTTDARIADISIPPEGWISDTFTWEYPCVAMYPVAPHTLMRSRFMPMRGAAIAPHQRS